MKRTLVSVLSARQSLVDRLRSRAPVFEFTTSLADGTGIVIVDAGDERGGEIPCRIVLESPEASRHIGHRRRGQLTIAGDRFEAEALELLLLCRDFAEASSSEAHLRHEIQFLEHLQELSKLGDSQSVSQRIAQAVLDILGLPVVTLLMHDVRVERFVVGFSNDATFEDSGEFVPGISPSLLQAALDAPNRWAVQQPETSTPGMIVMPIEISEDMIGVLRIPFAETSELDEVLADRAAHYLAMVTSVLGNIYLLTRSKDLALRDDLTQAYNRRFFDAYLEEEIERARRFNGLFSIIFLDLDDLKLVNNAHGHLAGSRTLQEVARRILGAVRAIDKVVRFGGDEFCIILPQTDVGQARTVAQRVRRAVSEAPIHLEAGIDIAITASFGIAAYPTHAVTKEDLVRCADAAMFGVKETTKNAIAIAADKRSAARVEIDAN